MYDQSGKLRHPNGKELSSLEWRYLKQLRDAELPEPVFQFALPDWPRSSYDFAWPNRKILVEINGGSWIKGAHGRGWGITRDCIKQNRASLAGYHLLSFTSDMIREGLALEATRKALNTFPDLLEMAKYLVEVANFDNGSISG